jgi:hypothetical protein
MTNVQLVVGDDILTLTKSDGMKHLFGVK